MGCEFDTITIEERSVEIDRVPGFGIWELGEEGVSIKYKN